MQLQDFYDYKERLMADLLTNAEIVRLINADVPVEEAKRLLYTQVFPMEYVPETAQSGKTYICCDVDIEESEIKTYYSPIMYIWIFSHRSQLRLPEGGIRTDKLCSEICKAINGSRFYGLGELQFYAAKRFAPMTDYQGKVLVFHMKEFSRLYDPKKPTPVNRKGRGING